MLRIKKTNNAGKRFPGDCLVYGSCLFDVKNIGCLLRLQFHCDVILLAAPLDDNDRRFLVMVFDDSLVKIYDHQEIVERRIIDLANHVLKK